MGEDLKLATTLAVSKTDLVVVYEVTNRTSRDAYLLNRLYRRLPHWDMSPNIVYAELDPRTETVLLSKRIADMPQGIYVTTPVAPYVTPLRAGSTFREEVRITLPIREYRQYRSANEPAGDHLKPRLYKNVTFTLGYYWRPEDTTEEIQEIHGERVVIPRTPPTSRPEFGRLESGPMRADVPVLEPSHP
jgi:hypothetical protein